MRGRSAFANYVSARSTRLLRIAYLLCRDWHTAEDLVQAALGKAWVAWPRITKDPDAYVYRILITTRNSWWRRRWHGEIPTGDLPEAAGGTDTADLVSRQVALWDALGRLSRQQRAVVVLRYFEDFSEERIAEALGCGPGTVKVHAHRALARLRVDPELATIATDR